MNVRNVGGLFVLALFVTAGSAEAQGTSVRFTGSTTTGSFVSSLAPDGFSFDVIYGQQTPSLTFEDYAMESFVGVNLGVMLRRNQLGVELNLGMIPTAATSIGQFSSAPDYRFSVGPDFTTVEISSKIDSQQKLFLGGLNLVFFPKKWVDPALPPQTEFYLTGGAGLVRYLDDEPLHSWVSGDTKPSFNVGVGLNLNFTSTFVIRIDLRDQMWKADVNAPGGEVSTLQHAIMFSPGIQLVR
jgi:hypothetical protein